jgi:hypothetical protein
MTPVTFPPPFLTNLPPSKETRTLTIEEKINDKQQWLTNAQMHKTI